jgi:hypothetical protein
MIRELRVHGAYTLLAEGTGAEAVAKANAARDASEGIAPACPRCGEPHETITWNALARPLEIGPIRARFWGACPANGDPVLLLDRMQGGEIGCL